MSADLEKLASRKVFSGLRARAQSAIRSAAARMITLPTSVEPVKESLRIFGWLASGPPHSAP